ncbi:MAG: divalent-cation tolerance protein CutA [Proteobacteria bacterium]|nr:divalent-cation tolerance protein CutA [Pseudomonadota bacterium]
MSDAVVLYITCRDKDEALMIGRLLVEEKLAACANVIGGLTSIFSWQGAIETADEALLILKTVTTLIEPATDRIRELHGYEVPCVVALPIVGGNPDFLKWIGEETAG